MLIDRVVEGVLHLDDIGLLAAAANGWSYRPPQRGENLAAYRRALATHIRAVHRARELMLEKVKEAS